MELVYDSAMTTVSPRDFILALPDHWECQHVREQCARIRQCKTFQETLAVSIWMVKPVDLDALDRATVDEMAEVFGFMFEHDFGDRQH